MLVELKKLNIVNEGYKRAISISRIYINPTHVLSVKDYVGAREFLISEGADQFAQRDFSLVKMSHGDRIEEIIALGTSEEVYKAFSGPNGGESNGKKILNG